MSNNPETSSKELVPSASRILQKVADDFGLADQHVERTLAEANITLTSPVAADRRVRLLRLRVRGVKHTGEFFEIDQEFTPGVWAIVHAANSAGKTSWLEFLVLPLRGAPRDLPDDGLSWLHHLSLDAYDTITAETGKLRANIKKDQLDPSEVKNTTAFFEDLPADRADALGAGLFGLYTNTSRTPVVANNVLMLWPELWPEISEEARQRFGVQYGRFSASADMTQARAAKELLNLVDGGAYLPENERAAEIDGVLDDLLAAHHGYNDFHTEPAPARSLAVPVGQYGNVPEAVEGKHVLTLVEVFLGNEWGVSNAAVPSYDKLFGKLTSSQAGRVLRSFTEAPISAKLWSAKPRARWKQLLDIIEPKLTARSDRELFEAVGAFTGTPDKLASDTKIARLATPRRVVRRPKKK